MRWVIVAGIVLVVIIIVLIIVKIQLHRRLNNIDGFCGIHTEDLNRNTEIVIGSFGDNEPKDKP